MPPDSQAAKPSQEGSDQITGAKCFYQELFCNNLDGKRIWKRTDIWVCTTKSLPYSWNEHNTVNQLSLQYKIKKSLVTEVVATETGIQRDGLEQHPWTSDVRVTFFLILPRPQLHLLSHICFSPYTGVIPLCLQTVFLCSISILNSQRMIWPIECPLL